MAWLRRILNLFTRKKKHLEFPQPEAKTLKKVSQAGQHHVAQAEDGEILFIPGAREDDC